MWQGESAGGGPFMRNTVAEIAGKTRSREVECVNRQGIVHSRMALIDRYRAVRQFSEKICETLEPEDYVIQTMPEMSPTKWHLAHVSWFFETFVLKVHLPDYE